MTRQPFIIQIDHPDHEFAMIGFKSRCTYLAPGAATLLDKADDAVDPRNGTLGKPDPSDIID